MIQVNNGSSQLIRKCSHINRIGRVNLHDDFGKRFSISTNEFNKDIFAKPMTNAHDVSLAIMITEEMNINFSEFPEL